MNEKDKKSIIEEYQKGASSVKLAEKYGYKAPTICSMLKRNGISRRSNKENSRKYHYDVNYFENIDTPDKAYWLGFIYADGYIHGQNNNKLLGIALSEKDTEHLEKFRKSLQSDSPIRIYNASPGNSYSDNRYCRIQLFGEKIYNDLVTHGVVEHKTLKITPPELSEELIPHFIRGYFDGDGCHTHFIQHTHNNTCHTRKDVVKIIGTTELLSWMEKCVFDATGVTSNGMFKRRSSDEVMGLEYSSVKKSFGFLNYIYQDAELYLDRKYELYIDMLAYIYSRRFLKRSPLKSLELSGKPLELAKLQYENEKSLYTNA